MNGIRLQYFVRALIRKGSLTIRSARNVRLATQAADLGVCRITPAGDGHRVLDPHWKVWFGIEVTDFGRQFVRT